MNYKIICQAILRQAKADKLNFRPIMRRWIKIFEDTRVVNWNRDEFLDEMIKCKKEVENGTN